MNFLNKEIISNTVRAKVSEQKLDFRLSFSLKKEFWISKLHPIVPASRPRCFHAYCLGTPRSGTHSISYMLEQNYNARHEPNEYYAIYHLLKWRNGQYKCSDIKNILKWRDKKLSLDLEAAHYLHYAADVLAESFPQAKFIFTVRDPLSWLESEINRNYETRYNLFWRALENHRYGRYGSPFTKYDSPLEKMGLYPICSYLSYWRDHNQFILNSVPQNRLITLETKKIRAKVDEIAEFLDIDANTIDKEKAHSDKSSKKFNLSELVDQTYLCRQLETICSDLIDVQLPLLKRDWYSLI